MSTTFHVFPTLPFIPTFNQLIERADRHLCAFLHSCVIDTAFTLTVTLRQGHLENDHQVPTNRDAPAWWNPDQYAWFQILGLGGGTDAYAKTWADFDRAANTGEFKGAKALPVADLLPDALRLGRSWCFRRSAGQSSVINLAYGILAASLAELTDGFIHTSDSAWDYDLFPARPECFLRWYFRPELTLDPKWKQWAQRNIAHLQRDLLSALENS